MYISVLPFLLFSFTVFFPLHKTMMLSVKMSTLTDELKHLLKILPEVLLAVVGSWQPFVSQPGADVVEGQVRGDVDHVADVEVPQQLQVLGVPLIPQVEKGKDGADHGVLRVWSHHALVGQGRRK